MTKIQNSGVIKYYEEQLFLRYLQICNQALESHQDDFPYKQLWESVQKGLQDKTISLAVYDDHPKVTYDVAMSDNHIDVIGVRNETDNAWHVNLSYLEKVVANPEEYINNPAKIDWEWISHRLSSEGQT
jgi:hypothetical protein